MEPGKSRANIVGFARPQTSLFENDENDTLCDEDNEQSASQLGRYAEFMVCAELTKLGYYVVHVDAPGFDLIMTTDTMSVRVQVKSTSSVRHGECDWLCLTHLNGSKQKKARRIINRADADLIALYHHVFGTTVFVPISEASAHIKLPVSQVKEHEATRSLERALRKLRDFQRWQGGEP